MVAGNRRQGMPSLKSPVVDPNTGVINPVWSQLVQTLFDRTGGVLGNNSANFTYPDSTGDSNEFLAGDGTYQSIDIPTKLSQLTNDEGFIGTDALAGYVTTAELAPYALQTFVLGNFGNLIPNVDNSPGRAGTATTASRSDHTHPSDPTKVSQAQFSAAFGGHIANPGWFGLPFTNIVVAFGTSVLTTDVNGNVVVPFGITFAHACLTFVAMNGNIAVNPGNPGALSLSTSGASVYTAAVSKSYQINWISIGW